MRHGFDVVCAAIGLVLLFPLFVVIAFAIKVEGRRGPVFYFQPRVGKDGREFYVIKFRSMVNEADRHGPLTGAEDPRITPVGRVLRKYKLDELPQLINVLRGDMRLVGPRPEMRKYVDMFRSEYEALLKDLPGITDPASLVYCDEEESLRGDSIEGYYVSQILPQKLTLSLDYSRRRTFFSDLRIIFKTMRAVSIAQRRPSLINADQPPICQVASKK